MFPLLEPVFQGFFFASTVK